MEKHIAPLRVYPLLFVFLSLIMAMDNPIFGQSPIEPIQKISWIIQLSSSKKSKPNPSSLLQLIENQGMVVSKFEAIATDWNVFHLEANLSPQTNARNLKARVAQLPNVLHLIENVKINDRSPPIKDPYYANQWQLSNSGAFGWPDVDIDAEDAWSISRGGTTALGDTIVIAVIDNAVLLRHPDLKANWWTNAQEIPDNGIDDDGNGYIDDPSGWNFNTNSNDVTAEGLGSSHGTPVCGIIGAKSGNGIGVSGLCPEVKMLPVIKGSDLISILKAHRYILQLRRKYNQSQGREGAFIVAVNASWGRDSMRAEEAPLWCELYDEMGAEGILFAAAAPNADVNIDEVGDMPADCASEYIISVTNSNHYDEKVIEAGYGRLNIDLAAPGNNSFTTINSGGYGYFGGCSAATPYVSGAISLLYSLPAPAFAEAVRAQPAETALLIKRMLLEQVDQRPAFAETTRSGGRLNVYRALLALADHFAYQHPRPTSLKLNTVYPSPASGSFTMDLVLARAAPLYLEVLAVDGRLLAKRDWGLLDSGQHRLYVEGAGWPAGVLLLRLRAGDQLRTLKLLHIP